MRISILADLRKLVFKWIGPILLAQVFLPQSIRICWVQAQVMCKRQVCHAQTIDMQAPMMINAPWKLSLMATPASKKEANIYPHTLITVVVCRSMMVISVQAMVSRTNFIPTCHVWYVNMKGSESSRPTKHDVGYGGKQGYSR